MISCDSHDYVEIACMMRYQVRLHRVDGQVLVGEAVDIRSRSGDERLMLATGEAIPLVDIREMEVLSKPSYFERVIISAD